MVIGEVPVNRSVHGIAEHGEARSHGSKKAPIFILLGATHLSIQPQFRRSNTNGNKVGTLKQIKLPIFIYFFLNFCVEMKKIGDRAKRDVEMVSLDCVDGGFVLYVMFCSVLVLSSCLCSVCVFNQMRMRMKMKWSVNVKAGMHATFMARACSRHSNGAWLVFYAHVYREFMFDFLCCAC